MKLILFRHGLAVERDEFRSSGSDDSLRPLVPKGRQRTQLMSEQLVPLIKQESLLLVSSPYLRAQQTADIIDRQLKPHKRLESMELLPSAPAPAFSQWLRLHVKGETTVIAVGHEPQLSSFASWCLSAKSESFIELKKSGAVCLELESFAEAQPPMLLKWLLQPKIFL